MKFISRAMVPFLCILLLLFAFSSCAGKTEEDATSAPSETESAPEETTPAVPEGYFPAPTVEEARNTLLQYYYDMSQIKWICKSDMDFTEGKSYTASLYYKAGETYYGLPYCSSTGYPEQFLRYLDADGVYTGPIKYETCIGNSCAPSIRVAMNAVSGSITASSTSHFNPWSEKGLVAVGDYVWDGIDLRDLNLVVTSKVTSQNGEQTMFEAYALCLPGDTIASRWESGSSVIGHARLVSAEPTLIRNNDGQINGARSFLTVYEQCSSFNKNSEVNTTFKIDQTYSFKDLYTAGYIPTRLADFASGKMKDAQITCEKISNAKSAISTTAPLSGTITCDNYNILLARVAFYDSEGNAVSFADYTPKSKTVKLSSQSLSVLGKDLPSGEYRFVVTVKIGLGTYTYCDTPVTKK